MSDRGRNASIILATVAGLLAVSALVAGVARGLAEPGAGDMLLAAGLLGVVVLLCVAAVLVPMLSIADENASEIRGALRDVERAVRHMGEQAALSDDARRVLNRTNERELLCRAIQEDIRKHDWEAADVLCTELSSRFGYHRDAERFRTEIESAKAHDLDTDVAEACRDVDQLIVERRWDDASRLAAEVESRFSASPRARTLRDRVRRARQQYKEELERRFLLAAQSDRIDEAMDLLRELDQYLTEQEAEPFREVARGVIGRARQNLGAAFKLAYQDQQWGIAAGLGEQIVEQFPNTRMAAEVESLLDELRQKAEDSRHSAPGVA